MKAWPLARRSECVFWPAATSAFFHPFADALAHQGEASAAFTLELDMTTNKQSDLDCAIEALASEIMG